MIRCNLSRCSGHSLRGLGVLRVENQPTLHRSEIPGRPSGDAHMRIRALILLPFLVCSSFIVARAQVSATLQPGVPIERTLGPGQVHEFTVNAKANSLVQLV